MTVSILALVFAYWAMLAEFVQRGNAVVTAWDETYAWTDAGWILWSDATSEPSWTFRDGEWELLR